MASDWITNYLPGMIREGLSGAEMLRRLRSPTDEGGPGLSIRTQTFYRALGETIDALGKVSEVGSAPLGRRPVADEITAYASRQATGYLYSFDVLVRNKTTGEVYYTPAGYRTDRLVQMRTAMGGAIGAIVEAGKEGSPSAGELDVLGAIATEVREYQPEVEL